MAANPTLAEIIDAIETAPPDAEKRALRKQAAAALEIDMTPKESGKTKWPGWPDDGARGEVARKHDAERIHWMRWLVVVGKVGDDDGGRP